MSKVMELGEEVIHLGKRLLKAAAENWKSVDPAPLSQYRASFVFRHHNNAVQLGEDVLRLHRDGRNVAARVCVRPIIEGVLNIAATVESPDFCVKKLVWELEEEIRRTRAAAVAIGQTNYEGPIPEMERDAKEMREKFKVDPKKHEMTAAAIAVLGKMQTTYALAYPLFSRHTHATARALLPGNEENTDWVVLHMTVQCLIVSATGVLKLLNVGDSTGFVDDLESFVKRQKALGEEEKKAHP